MTDATSSHKAVDGPVAGEGLKLSESGAVSPQENDADCNGHMLNGGAGQTIESAMSKTNGGGGHYHHHCDEPVDGEHAAVFAKHNGEERNHLASSADLNDVIQQQLQPLLESVSLNGASMSDLQQQLAAQFSKQSGVSGGHMANSGMATTVLVHGNSNGSSSSASPPLKTSESSISPAAQSTSQQISSASSSSIISTGSHSNNWSSSSGSQSQQQQQSSLSSISPNEASSSSSGGLDNMSSAAAAAAWTSALNGGQQQISPSQTSNGGVSMNMAQQKQLNPAALASLLKANNLAGGAQTSSSILNTLNSIYTPSQLLKGNPSAVAALAALAEVNGKAVNGGQQRSLLTNSSNGIQQGQNNGYIEEQGQTAGQLDLSMFNGHLIEMIKNDPAQLEQILKLRSMYQSEEANGTNGVSNGANSFMEELQHQLDQTVPANLAAAVAAAAAANNGGLNLNVNLNQANPNRNSPRSALNMQKYHQHQHHGSNGHQHQQQQQHNFHHHNNNHHQHHHNSMLSNGANGNGGHMMMNHGYNGMPKQHQQQAYQQQQHHHHYQQQQQHQYHPNQFGIGQIPQNFHQNFMNMTLQQQHQFNQFQDCQEERFSRKVFVGGLPPDIDEDEIVTHFRRYGNLIVDWPHKAESKSYFPPKGYAFLIFQEERNVQDLIETCVMDDGKLYMVVSSPSMKDKAVQIRPWCLADSDFVMDGSQPLDPRKTIFVGGVPRPLKAIELAMIMDRLYGGVCYAGIDTDPELKYPKGAGRVAFSNQQSYIAAISARFVQLHHGEIDKRVEVKPYVLDDQMCDECQGVRCGGKFAPFFCANVTCLQYYCEQCWTTIHSRPGREYHKPLVKEGADRPRPVPYAKS